MKKMLLGAVGLSAALASCGVGGAPDGSGSGRVSQVRTEYRTEGGQFVACDNVTVGGNTATAGTQVSVYFSVFGNVQSVDVGLRGNTSSQYDDNYNATASGEELAALGNGNYRVTFNANPATGGFLPQAIIVTPVRDKVKIVSTNSTKAGSFYAALKVNTGTAVYNFNSRNLLINGNVEVYPNCTVLRTTDEEV